MSDIDNQLAYWNRVAHEKTFSHPLHIDRFRSLVPANGEILDYGCGYGRVCQQLWNHGFTRVIGVDTSAQMIARGQEEFPHLKLQVQTGTTLPFDDDSFDAVLLFAVLTCIPTDAGQQHCLQEIRRVLRVGGIVYISTYCIQDDERNRQRYEKFASEFHTYGVFRLPEGAVMRHHDEKWVRKLMADFEAVDTFKIDVKTMNNNPAKVFQYIGRKT